MTKASNAVMRMTKATLLRKTPIRQDTVSDHIKYQPDIALRTSMSDYREQDWMTNVPLYALTSYLKTIE